MRTSMSTRCRRLAAVAFGIAVLAGSPALGQTNDTRPPVPASARQLPLPASGALAADETSPTVQPPGDPDVRTAAADVQPGLQYTCCERNIKLTGAIKATGATGVVPPPPATATSRWLSVVFAVPISWECKNDPRLKDCNGTVVATPFSHPANEAGAAPTSTAVVVKGIRKDCDGKPGMGNVLVEYSASYASTDAIDGGLVIKIETPAVGDQKKGDVFLKLSVDVRTAGNGVTLSEPKTERLPRR